MASDPLSTQTFFENEATQAAWYHKDLSTLENMGLCCRHNEEALQSYILTGVVIGILAIWAMDPVSSSLDLAFTNWKVLSVGAFGFTSLLVSAVTYIVIKIFKAEFAQCYDQGIFKENDILDHQRKLNGKLIILKNGIPCLMIANGSDAKGAGRTHGYLVASALNAKIKYLRWDLWVASFFNPNTRALVKNSKDLVPKMLNNLPVDLKQQLEGIVEGYNYWCQENNTSNKGLTVEELFLYHLVQDSARFDFQMEAKKSSSSELSVKASNPVACTTFVAKDPNQGMNMMCILDGKTNSFFRDMTILIATDMGNGIKTLELGFAGRIGTYTGMNNMGLGIAMNGSLTGNHVINYAANALPSVLYNKMLLQEPSLRRVERFIEQESFTPFAAYHLIVADKEDAAAFHFCQKESVTSGDRKWKMLDQKHLVRYKQKDDPLFVTNPTYVNEQEAEQQKKLGFSVEKDAYGLFRAAGGESWDKERRLQSAWDASKTHAQAHGYAHSPASVVKNVSKIGGVNNGKSTHVVHMNLNKRTFSFAVAKNFVGSLERLECSFEDIFSESKFPYRIRAGKQEEV